MPRLPRTVLLLSALLVLFAGRAPAAPSTRPTGVAARRLAWLYNKGSFKKMDGKRWVEQNARARYTFREIARTDSYVGLYDATRKVHLRLYDRSVYWWSAKNRKWNYLHFGRWENPRKRPLNGDRFPNERGKLQNQSERRSFPHLGREYEVLGPATTAYNCIAWTIGATNRWIWPAKKDKPATVRDFDDLYAKAGYKRLKVKNYDKVTGFDKIVLYAKRKADGAIEPTHGARQLADGSWSSKLGRLPLIRHLAPEDLDGVSYGVPYAVYVRKQPVKR